MAVQRARLCIVSPEPFHSAHFVAALCLTLGLEDDLEIIVDRRHGQSFRRDDPQEDRRHQPQVDVELEENGFAIVPTVDPTEPIDRSRTDDEDRKREENVRDFLHERPGTLMPKLLGILSGAIVAALVLLLVGYLNAPSRSSQLSTDSRRGEPDRPPEQNNGSLPRVSSGIQQAVIVPTAPLALADSTPLPAAETASTRPDSPRDADRITPKPRETSAAPAAPETGAIVRPTRSASSRSSQVAAVSPPEATAKAESTQLAGSPRAELIGEPISRGWGDSYAVRVLDPAGRPLLDASVQLIASMADGTVEDVAMGALAEPGTYRGTVPTNRSTPVELRVRVATGGGGSVDVPLSR